ncbi:type II toxin-antitoxin system VapC family toxin [Haloglomus litoreum]|uniref:type II toxin-antitoxin system VapC family toxin n=1 Tax=Haloglomus litoreum TaxID=3034026 RepID=UPI0023E81DB1|nr:type II toxin-antitoxin system VapC family toxin [Haloglomus sp. DT116]
MRLLDTSVLARWGHPERQQEVVPYLQRHADEQFVTSSLVVFEFFRPARRRENSEAVHAWLGRVLDGVEGFTQSGGLTAASVEANLARHDTSLEMRDLLIGSHARDIGATFVTCDRDDFEREPVQQLLDVDVIVDSS